MAVLYSKIEQDMDCAKEVVIWNYWDREHLTGTHYQHYCNVRVLAENDNWCLGEYTVKLPLIPFKVITRNFAYLDSPQHFKSIHIGKFSLLEQDFYFEDKGPTACKVTLENRMRLPIPEIVAKLLQPLWEKFTRRWFYATWEEDLAMRHRRWKVWQLGFRDFTGIDYINQKKAKPKDRGESVRFHPVELPVKKSTPIGKDGWPRLFSKSVELGYETTTEPPESSTDSAL